MSPGIVLGLVIGLILLVGGAHALTKGAASVSRTLGISPLIIGLTIVAYGTSAPETAINIIAARAGQGDIGIGNILGSCTFNVLFILGLSALIRPLQVHVQLLRWDVPVMIGVVALCGFLSLDARLGRGDGLFLLSVLLVYTVMLLRKTKRESAQVRETFAKEFGDHQPASRAGGVARDLLLLGLGLGGLTFGAHLLVGNAVKIAEAMRIPSLLVGMTVVTFGTTLPELMTSLMAARRGDRDIAIGNVVGSNIFNVVGVLGLSASLSAHALPVSEEARGFGLPVLLAASVLCMPIFYRQMSILRLEGASLLGLGCLYYGAIFIRSQGGGLWMQGLGFWLLLALLIVIASAISYLEERWMKAKRRQ